MPNAYQSMSTAALEALVAELEQEAEAVRAKGLALDMARGKQNRRAGRRNSKAEDEESVLG